MLARYKLRSQIDMLMEKRSSLETTLDRIIKTLNDGVNDSMDTDKKYRDAEVECMIDSLRGVLNACRSLSDKAELLQEEAGMHKKKLDLFAKRNDPIDHDSDSDSDY